MVKGEVKSDYEELMKRAQEQPGIEELVVVYGGYENMIQQSHEYLMGMMPRFIISSDNRSDYYAYLGRDIKRIKRAY